MPDSQKAQDESLDRNDTAPTTCPDCDGSGRLDGGECRACGGTGEVELPVGGG